MKYKYILFKDIDGSIVYHREDTVKTILKNEFVIQDHGMIYSYKKDKYIGTVDSFDEVIQHLGIRKEYVEKELDNVDLLLG